MALDLMLASLVFGVHVQSNCSAAFNNATHLSLVTDFLNSNRKKKFLDAYEGIFSVNPATCHPKNVILDVGAGDGIQSYWYAARCKCCARGVDMHPPNRNKYSVYSTAKRFSNWSQLFMVHQHLMPVEVFDGRTLSNVLTHSVDVVVFNSVLHHAAAATCGLLAEARRVSRKYVIVFEDVALEKERQRVDARHKRHDAKGVFRSEAEWNALFAELGFSVDYQAKVGSKELSEAMGRLGLADSALDYLFQRVFLLSKIKVGPHSASTQHSVCSHS